MKYRADIDGLRAFAVIPVVLFHAGFEFVRGGYIGVDVFFVISGFLITSIIINNLEGNGFSLVDFYERRARRILPALFFVMAISFVFSWLIMFPSQMKDFSQSLVAVVFFASNFLFWSEDDYFSSAAEEKPLLHTWSLGVEEQYYLFFPLFLILFWRFGKARVFCGVGLIALLSFILSEWGWRNAPVANFYLAPTRAWELLAGSIVAFFISKGRVKSNSVLGGVGLLLVLLPMFLYDESVPFPSFYALPPVLGVVLIVLFSAPGSFVYRLLSARFFVFIGLISYSVYLWHQPLFSIVRICSVNHPSGSLMAALSVMSFVVGYLSWRFVEAPFRDGGFISRRNIFICSFFGAVMFSFAGVAGHMTNGYEFRIGEREQAFLDKGMSAFEDSIGGCWERIDNRPGIDGACDLGDGKATFSIIGDSHAATIQNEISAVANSYGIKGFGLSYRSCPPLMDVEPVDKESSAAVSCKILRHDIFDSDKLDKLPEYVVVSARWPLLINRERYENDSGYKESGDPWVWALDDIADSQYAEAMKEKIFSSLSVFLESGKTLVLVYPVPEMAWNVPNYLARSEKNGLAITNETASVSYESYLERNAEAFEVLDSLKGNVLRVYPGKLFCKGSPNEVCLSHLDRLPLYYDDDHLSDYGARFLAEAIVEKIVANEVKKYSTSTK